MPQIVARCTKCPRTFIWVNPNSEMIDNHPPQGSKPPKDGSLWEDCGGRIEMLPEPKEIS